jgi:hypothetical protein
MDWKAIAERRLERARIEVEEAKKALDTGKPITHERYAHALIELERARRFADRVASGQDWRLADDEGLLG